MKCAMARSTLSPPSRICSLTATRELRQPNEREDAADLNYDRHSENGERAEPAGEHFVRTVMEDHASIPDANEADCHALG
jgi:hypothetical protein